MTKTKTQAKPRTGQDASAGPRKTRYISINLDDELAALEELSIRERWVYLCCKQLANFKTGVVGTYRNQKLSYVDISAMVKAPARQGRGDGTIDDTQAADIIKRMEAVGLVSNIGRRNNGGLRFELPLSPIGRKKADLTAQIAGKMPEISPDEPTDQIAANPALAGVGDESGEEVSVVINTKRNINTDGAAASIDAAAPRRASGAAPSGEVLAGGTAATAPLTAADIREALAESYLLFEAADDPQASAFFLSWAEAGITLDELQAAMTSVEESVECPDKSAADLHDRIWPMVVDRFVARLAA